MRQRGAGHGERARAAPRNANVQMRHQWPLSHTLSRQAQPGRSGSPAALQSASRLTHSYTSCLEHDIRVRLSTHTHARAHTVQACPCRFAMPFTPNVSESASITFILNEVVRRSRFVTGIVLVHSQCDAGHVFAHEKFGRRGKLECSRRRWHNYCKIRTVSWWLTSLQSMARSVESQRSSCALCSVARDVGASWHSSSACTCGA